MFGEGQLYYDSYTDQKFWSDTLDDLVCFEKVFFTKNEYYLEFKCEDTNWISLCRIFGVVAEFTWKAYYETFGRV